MKISVIFPIADSAAIDKTLVDIKPFVQSHQDCEIIVVCPSVEAKGIFDAHKGIKGIVIDKFTINNAIESALPFATGEVVLVGDYKLDCNQIFDRMLKEHEDGADIVTVHKKRNWFTKICFDIGTSITNFFTRMYTDKKDSFGVPSIQLLDRNVIDIALMLPKKSGLIRNADNLIGIEYATIELDKNDKPSCNNYKVKNATIISTIVGGSVSLASILAIIFSNVFAKVPLVCNIILFLLVLCGVLVALFGGTKHILDIRMGVGDYKLLAEYNTKVIAESPAKKIAKIQDKKVKVATKTASKIVTTKATKSKVATTAKGTVKTVAKASAKTTVTKKVPSTPKTSTVAKTATKAKNTKVAASTKRASTSSRATTKASVRKKTNI